MVVDQMILHKVKRTLHKVNKWQPTMQAMSDEELQGQTAKLRQQLKAGKTLDQILPEAFATIREADYRLLGMFPYDVQVMGAIVLHSGNIAEMKTGEGKTLTATMPLYLNALEGKGAMLVTPNGYLAERDEEQLEPVYNWLGLTATVAFPNEGEEKKKVTPAEKRDWYNHDIIYTTASGLAFDYLFNNLASSTESQYLRPYNYVIIDEVDDVLLDEATSPFVVSSVPMLQSNLYGLAENFVSMLVPKMDYRLKRDDKAVYLTYHGVRKAERFFRVKNLFDASSREIYRHIALALRAHHFMRNGREYLVENGKVILLDETNGRLKHGVKVSTGLHQAVEAKEHVELTPNQKVAASITFPGLFGLFNKIAGMSGTVKVNENEFMNVYKMRVVQVPTNKPVIRKDYPDQVYITTTEKMLHAINYALQLHKQGRPILLVAGSVENSEIISEILLNYGVPHNVLNAFNAAREAAMIKDAGQEGAVTVATNMAGRGTDIKLGPGVKEKGGLAVIGTEMLSPRVRLQLAGRAGRQGDPGSSRFFISLEDNFISQNSTKRFKQYYRKLVRRYPDRDQPLHSPRLLVSLAMLRSRVAGNEEASRKRVNKNELALRLQRDNFYQERRQIMGANHFEQTVGYWISEAIDYYLAQKEEWTVHDLSLLINDHFSYDVVEVPAEAAASKQQAKQYLEELSRQILTTKSAVLVNNEQLNHFYRSSLLNAIDSCWMDEMELLTNLRAEVQPWAMAGRDPSFEYQQRAFNAYRKMLLKAKLRALDNLLLSTIKVNKKGELVVSFN